DRFRRVKRTNPTDAAENDPAQSDIVEHRLNTDARPHRVTDVIRLLDVQVIQEASNIGRHQIEGVGGRIVRLIAFAMASAIKADHTISGGGESFLPSRAD